MSYRYSALGMMSGTSLDGLDIAYCKFEEEKGQWRYQLIKASTIPYNGDWRSKLEMAISLPPEDLNKLDYEYGIWLGERAKNFIETEKLAVDLISSHGHTIFHQPEKGITKQIGNGQALANLTRMKVICDFRSRDVSLGGQGAPLVPIGDELLFNDFSACLNLGGVANISYAHNGERIAFDIGLANMPLNYLASKLGQSYDRDGATAKSGRVDHELLARLNSLAYFSQSPPKSLGVEWFNQFFKPLLENSTKTVADILATSLEHEAQQIGRAINAIGTNSSQILVTGGGALNNYLIERITSYLPDDVEMVIPDIQLVEFKEALIFAFLGVLRENNKINCLKSVTGASKDSSGGEIFIPNLI